MTPRNNDNNRVYNQQLFAEIREHFYVCVMLRSVSREYLHDDAVSHLSSVKINVGAFW